jgi:hypothetical protein
MDRAEVWVALTDGGAGLEELVPIYFPRVEGVRDFYPAAEHLGHVAQALYTDEAQAHEAAGLWCHTLQHEGGQALLTLVEALEGRGRKGERGRCTAGR